MVVLLRGTAAGHGPTCTAPLSEAFSSQRSRSMQRSAAEQTTPAQIVNELQDIWYLQRFCVISCRRGGCRRRQLPASSSLLLSVLKAQNIFRRLFC